MVKRATASEVRNLRLRFQRARLAEREYGRQLRAVAREIGNVVAGFVTPAGMDLPALRAALHNYASILQPWAQSVGQRMIAEVSQRDERAWHLHASAMGEDLRRVLRQSPIGDLVRRSLQEQVSLITSLPREAAERVHQLMLRGLETGMRPETLAKEILRTGEVTQSRANTIARTEVSRTATALTEARAVHIGSEGYRWRTARDSDVRRSHKKMEGKFVPWGSPPELDGMTGHAGEFPNCRCYPEPVLPDRF